MINHIKKYVYVHIPKTGGVSITNSLLENEGFNFKTHFSQDDLPSEVREKYLLGGERQHKFLSQYKEIFQKDYFCFAFVRNPFERAVSAWTYYNGRTKRNISFEIFLEKKIGGRHLVPMVDFINENIDFIGRFENFSHDVNVVFKKIGIEKYSLLHLNKFPRDDYREYYNHKTKRTIYEQYKMDLEFFEYDF